MKKLLLFAVISLLSAGASAQCVYTCSNYIVSPITYTTYPSAGTNVVSQFSNNGIQNLDDGSTPVIPIGFTFEFYCASYTGVYITSNGFIQFDYAPLTWPGQYVHATQNIPDANVPNGMVAYNMTDLDPGAGGSVTYATLGTAPNRIFVVTYSNVPCFGQPNDLNTGQIVLRETSNIIEIHTGSAKPCTNQSLGSTQGIENTNASDAKWPTGRNGNNTWGSNANSTAFMFAPYSASPLASITGNTLLCQGTAGAYATTPVTGAMSYSWSGPAGWVGTSTTSAITFTAGATGALSVTATYTCGSSPATVLQVSVIPAPVVSIVNVSPSIVCSGQTVGINVSGATNYTLEPGNITGPGPQIVDVPMTSTQYTLYGSDASGCTSFNNPTGSIMVLESPTVTVNSGSVCVGQSFVMTPSGANSYQYSSIFSQVTPTVVGISAYTVVGTATNGCQGQALSSVTVAALPSATVTASRASMCLKETNTVSVTGASSYSWTQGGGTGTSVTFTANSLGPIPFNVIAYSPEGCSKTFNTTVMVSGCVGLAENSGKRMAIYPNPSTGLITLEAATGETIHIYDITGREVHRQSVSEGKNTLMLQQLPAGKYFVKGEDSQKTSVIVLTGN